MVAAVTDVCVDVKTVEDSAHGGAKHVPGRTNTSLSMSESTLSDPSVRLAWKNLLVKSVKGRELLKGVTGKIVGGFWAVMGPSGSGKTTLLNALACRMDRNTRMSGDLRLNGQSYNSSLIKKVSGYVMQDDVLNVHMTVGETLYYTAELRLPYLMTREEKQRRIDDIMMQVGLSHVRDVIVGSPLKKGISGGERKRLCVAMELLTEPSILFLDEPTSGLDSVTALSLCTLLADIAATGNTTVVCTIHQPQAKIFRLFQSLILLKSGHIVYQGAANKAVDYFAGTGHPCPAYENPADHVMDVITPSINDSVIDLKRKEELFAKAYQAPDVELELTELRPMVQFRDMVPWTKQFSVLLHRAFKEQWRKRTLVYFTVVQTIILALLLGATFYQIGDDIVSITKRQPALFFCVINQGIFGAITLITSFPSERLLTLRERAAGTYHVSAYFLSKQVVDTLCVQLPVPIIFSCICYWMIGFRAASSHFFIFTAFMILCNMAATSMALMVAALSRTVDMSVTILPMALELTRLYGGFFVPPATMPIYFRWLFHMSYISYVYPAIVNNELWDLTLRCPTPLLPPPGRACPLQNRLCYTNGRTPVNINEFNFLSVGQCAACLIAYCVITRTIAYCAIRWIKW